MMGAVLAAVGCSAGSPLTPPAQDGQTVTSGELSGPAAEGRRLLWGLYDVAMNRKDGRVSIAPLREGCFHLNALQFLEPPAMVGLSISGPMIIDQPGNYVSVDVVLTHPFPGAQQFMGFDVRGIVLMPGSDMPFTDPSLIFSRQALPSEPMLLNPDGLTRWWNPKEFPGTGIFGFQEGLIGGKGGAGVFTATVNGYKYFADGLGSDQPVWTTPQAGRGSFSAGATNKRRYDISFGSNSEDWLKFQYAIDASWIDPPIDNPTQPSDFPIEANAPEGYFISVITTENTLWWLQGVGQGGKLDLSVDVYSWRPSAVKQVIIDAPHVKSSLTVATVVPGSGGGAGHPPYSTYEAEIVPDVLSSQGPYDVLVIAGTDRKYSQGGLSSFFGPSSAWISGYARTTVSAGPLPPTHWEKVTMGVLTEQPSTVAGDFSVVGSGIKKGVYFFGDDYGLYRYPIHYNAPAELVTTLAGFFGYTQVDLYGLPSAVGRFDLTQFGQFVSSTITDAESPTFLGGLKRDYEFFFNEFYAPGGQLPVQIGLPDPSKGFFRVIDVCANHAQEYENAKVYWIQADDPAEMTPPDPEVTVIMGVYQYAWGGSPWSGDIDYISGSVVPMGIGDGLVDIDCLDRFAVDGQPQGVFGSTDLIAWFLETSPPALECFSIVSSDTSGFLNQHLTTVKDFAATPRDIAIFPAYNGGYDSKNWVVVLEEGANCWWVECFDQEGNKIDIKTQEPFNFPFIGIPVNIDVDPVSFEVHVWFRVLQSSPVIALVMDLAIG